MFWSCTVYQVVRERCRQWTWDKVALDCTMDRNMSNGVAFESNDLQYSPHMREVWGRLASKMKPGSVLLNVICQMRHDTFVGMVLLDAKCEYVNPVVCLPPVLPCAFYLLPSCELTSTK